MSCRYTNVTDYLLEGKDPDRIALHLPSRQYSYGELQGAVARVTSLLLATGAQKSDRVILASENSLFWVAAYLGAMRAGLVCVPLPPSVPGADLAFILNATKPAFAFAQIGFAVKNTEHLRGLPVITERDVSQSSQDLAKFPGLDQSDLAALMFTSGSTGKPRGVMLSHRNIVANTESIIQYLGLTANDRIMDVLPFHYCFGTSLLHTHLRVGGSIVIEPRFMYPETVLVRMQETACTGFAGVPSHYQILLRNSSLRKKAFPHLRYVQQAGGHLAPSFIRELRDALPGTSIFIMYGQTEATARLSYLAPDVLDTKLGSIGKGIPGVTLRVLNESGHNVHPGELGEIVAQGDNVAVGYWCAPEETALSFREGKLYTGDLATIDEDGFIYIMDRAKDFLKCGGTRVSCRQIEDELLAFDGLLEAAVVGVPDEVLGEAVKAFIVPRGTSWNSLKDDLRAFCNQRLPSCLVPREVSVVPALPKNSSGKVLKQSLKTL
jgi:long-chain acyl-CoA synthetase